MSAAGGTMNVNRWIVILGLAAAAPPVWAQSGPSFRCTPDLVGAEAVICDNADLHPLDRELTRIYVATMNSATPGGKEAIRQAQRQWVQQRNACTLVTSRDRADIAECVRRSMVERIAELPRSG